MSVRRRQNQAALVLAAAAIVALCLVEVLRRCEKRRLRRMRQPACLDPQQRVDERLVVSLTTSPRRITLIEPMLRGVMSQTVVPSRIVLNLPHVFKRDGSVFEEPLPDFIANNPRIVVNKCDDLGPATKIIPTVQLLQSEPKVPQGTIIVSLDDDILYQRDTLERFVRASRAHPQAVITGASYMPLRGTGEYELVEGWSGVAYRLPVLADLSPSTFRTMSTECFVSDDFVLSNHLRGKKIPIRRIDVVKTPLEYGLRSDGLHKGVGGVQDNWKDGRNLRYLACARHLHQQNNLHISYFPHSMLFDA
jgi:hypothetical protein